MNAERLTDYSNVNVANGYVVIVAKSTSASQFLTIRLKRIIIIAMSEIELDILVAFCGWMLGCMTMMIVYCIIEKRKGTP